VVPFSFGGFRIRSSLALHVLIACTFFFAAGQAFVPEFGIQTDEALFSEVIYPPGSAYTITVFKRDLPLMHMSYLGTLKGWFYTPVFGLFHPGVWSLRLPVLIIGAAAIAFFSLLLARIHGTRAALFGAALLAADASYLLTITFDWGPVAIHILLTVVALFLLVHSRVVWGFFCLGLALWHKALMLWILIGLAAAALALFRRELKPRRIPAAVLGLALGALPFAIYNIQTNFDTFRQNSAWTFSDIRGKAMLLRFTLDGSGLFGFLVHEDHQTEHAIPAQTALDRASYWVSETAGRRGGWLPYALAASLLSLPLLWRTRARTPILFALIVSAVAWCQMAVTQNAGGSVHHAVLLWPFPHLIVAVAAAEFSRRTRWAALPVLLVVGTNLLVLNQYYVQARRNGGAGNWSDACFPLTDHLVTLKPGAVFLADWGFFDTLRLLSRGSLRLDWALEFGNDQHLARWLSTPNALFVAHSPGSESFEGRRAQLLESSEKLGYRRELLDVIHDRNRRPRFEIYRFSAPDTPPQVRSTGNQKAPPTQGISGSQPSPASSLGAL
jgi:4-amino-4-deoxy-L-arabinose transferase-like glycosyltransferase